MEILTFNDLNRLNIKIRSKFAIDIGSRIKDKNRDMIIAKQVYKKYLNNKITKSYLYHCNICGFNEGIVSDTYVSIQYISNIERSLNGKNLYYNCPITKLFGISV